MQADGEYAGCCGGCFCWLLWSVLLLGFDYLWGRSLTRRVSRVHMRCACATVLHERSIVKSNICARCYTTTSYN